MDYLLSLNLPNSRGISAMLIVYEGDDLPDSKLTHGVPGRQISYIILQIFSYSSAKSYVVGAHLNCLEEAILMSTHNICFSGEIRLFFKKKKFCNLYLSVFAKALTDVIAVSLTSVVSSRVSLLLYGAWHWNYHFTYINYWIVFPGD